MADEANTAARILLGQALIQLGSVTYWAEQGDCPRQLLAALRVLAGQVEAADRALSQQGTSAQISARHNGETMFAKMPWDELRDGGGDEIGAELAELEAEEEERIFADELAGRGDRPGLAKTKPASVPAIATK